MLHVIDARRPADTIVEDVRILFALDAFIFFKTIFFLKISDSISEHDGHKRVIYVLSKADLVPRENLRSWLRYIRKTGEAAIAFRLVSM